MGMNIIKNDAAAAAEEGECDEDDDYFILPVYTCCCCCSNATIWKKEQERNPTSKTATHPIKIWEMLLKHHFFLSFFLITHSLNNQQQN